MSDTQVKACCHPPAEPKKQVSESTSCCATVQKRQFDWLLWGSLFFCSLFYLLALTDIEHQYWYGKLSHSVFELLNTMWWSVLLAMFFVGLISKIPQRFVLSIIGPGGTFKGLWRATAAGVLLDLCSHGILMVGMQLRQKGASLGQVMAFLIASPWNSLSLTLILFALIGISWTLLFILLSVMLAITTGWLFDRLEQGGQLPTNPQKLAIPANFHFWHEAKSGLQTTRFDREFYLQAVQAGWRGSKMVLRWLLFGVLLASCIRAFISLDNFQTWFGPTLFGLFATLVAATIIEVCSEGSAPIAADIMNRGAAPGNSFAFLMAGVATDYTEVMVIKDTTQSWKTALFLPLLTIPQVIVVAAVLNLSV